jgi:hypothetical protein
MYFRNHDERGYVCIRYLYRRVLPEKNIIANHNGKVSF